MRLSLIPFAGLLFAGTLMAVPDDLESSFQALKDAVSSKDAAQVKTLATQTSALARKTAAAPAPTDPAEKEAWTKDVAHAKEVDVFSEYALYSTSLELQPEAKMDMLLALEKQNPKSRYLCLHYDVYFDAMKATGGTAKVQAVAEKAIKSCPDSIDVLTLLANAAWARNQMAVAGTMAERMLTVLNGKMPEEVSDSEWDNVKTSAVPFAHLVAGVAHCQKNEFTFCDQDLRAALPLVKGTDGMLAPTLFYLGLANFNLGKQGLDRARILEAAKFSEDAAAIRSPYQQTAWTNAHLMKTEADKMVARK